MAQPALPIIPEQPSKPDRFVVLHGASWADYQRMLELRGEKAVPRLTFLEGALEIMSPSQEHESIKSSIGRLVEAYCFEMDIDISAYGSWTHESKESERGAEPDECYVLGDVQTPERADLAIEVIWTSGGIDKLEVYRKLGVREIWIWRDDEIQLFELRSKKYERIERSTLLPGLDLATLLPFVRVRPMTRAVREFRAALRAAR